MPDRQIAMVGFFQAQNCTNFPASWRHPESAGDFMTPDYYRRIARTLEDGLHYAVRTDAPGRPFIDYHTAQTPRARHGRTFATRRAELASDSLNTVLSTREWRTDACFTIALWLRSGGAVDMDDVAECLRHPRFVLYLGRKSAPLGLPLNPAIVEASTVMEAFRSRQPNDEERRVLERINAERMPHGAIACDHDAPGVLANGYVERRRDSIASRIRWQFEERLERIVSPDSPERSEP